MDMAIVNATHVTPYAEVDEEERELSDDLIFDRRPDALERFIGHFEAHSPTEEARVDPTADMTPEAAIHWMILHRKKEGIQQLVERAILDRGGDNDAAVHVLNKVLLPAMKAPTVQQLYNTRSFAVKAAVRREAVPKLIPTLRAAGATDILQTEIQRVIR